MPTHPETLTQPALEPCDLDAWTALLVDRPAVALISTRPHLGILLAKDVEQIHPPRTLLRGVRWVRVPTGWRGAATRMLARWRAVRLPEEWLFDAVSLEDRPRDDMPDGVAYVANLVTDHPRGVFLPDPSAHRFPLKFLTHRQYHALASAKGRALEARVRDIFRDALRDRRYRSPRPVWTLPLGASRRRRSPFAGAMFAG